MQSDLSKSISEEFAEQEDSNVLGYEPLISPELLKLEVPLSQESKQTIRRGRVESARCIEGKDPRLLVVIGPCSVHDPQQALEYADLLKEKEHTWPNLLLLMRSYPEKPRTTVGWKGLSAFSRVFVSVLSPGKSYLKSGISNAAVNDPDLNETFKINKGLRMTRQLYCDITARGLPVAVELLDSISPQFLSDAVSWGAIGARTTESQLHRELASGTSCPIGFKNGTDGSISIAVDAMRAAAAPHAFLGVSTTGLAAIVKTRGNDHVHVILRGASAGPNYSKEHVAKTKAALLKARPNHFPSIMIDCSHGNSQKDHRNQPKVLADVCSQLEAGENAITGVMVESFINAGRQDIPPTGRDGLKHGVSVTDACVDFPTTLEMLDKLDNAVASRNRASQKPAMNGIH